MESSLTILEGVTVNTLRRVHHPKGDIYHALKCTDSSFSEFGEAYFSTIYKNDLKGWKQHKKMIMNLIVPVGEVGFHFYNQAISKGAHIKVGFDNYVRITVQPGVWMAFEGISQGLNLVLNIASIPHDPQESINVEIDTFPLGEEVKLE